LKALLQRVKEASVTIEADQLGSINQGLLVLVGLEKRDDISIGIRILERILSYRVFNDAGGRMNLSVKDIAGGVLLVPQFTLAASTGRGLRPSFSDAMPPADAHDLFQEMCHKLKERHEPTFSGRFGADMQVALINDGPVTFLLELR
tara:strand:- start:441 stop:881 length:441 start_codon:yes stop_codon:yes gene_type:complete